MQNWHKLGVRPADFLLPANADMEKWSVVACDQYTAQKAYWEQCDMIVGDAPSALRLIIPEAYLSESEERIPHVQHTMRKYLSSGTLKNTGECFILTEREVENGLRLGLVLCVDLEKYDYAKGSQSLIRATEDTIVSRIPPRLKVRRDAPLELSHVLLLSNDHEKTVIEPLYQKRSTLEKLYDFPLMQGGGHLRGWKVQQKEDLRQVYDALDALYIKTPESTPFLAVGDGNHSLATAKAHWENVKKTLTEAAQETHPARFAMVELVNLYDDALVFEPIHRVLFHADTDAVMYALTARGMTPCDEESAQMHIAICGKDIPVRFAKPLHSLVVGTLQMLLDEYLLQHPETEIDYIHGGDAVHSLVSNAQTIGFLLQKMDKMQLFSSVAAHGTLPRKTFSMGHANEKRYYTETRKIVTE